MSEEWFWETEPRVVVSMIDEKQVIEKEKAKLNAFYIACFIVGKNPDEVSEKEIAGIDKPVTEEQLRAFNF